MKKNKKKPGATFIKIAIVILIISLAFGYAIMKNQKSSMTGTESKYKKVLIIGIDAMDPNITIRMMEKGVLPNFVRLSKLGVFESLTSTYPPETPVSWTTIATGVNPGKHGIYDFIEHEDQDYMPQLSITKHVGGFFGRKYVSSIKATPFWDITSRNGIQSTIIRWPVTFPPSPARGNMLSGLGTPDIKGFLSGSAFYTTVADTSQPEKSSNKLIIVNEEDGIIETFVEGPAIRKQGMVVNAKAKMTVRIFGNNSVAIKTGEKTYNIMEKTWSSWIRFEFDGGMFNKVHGIAKAYLKSTDPFMLYLTTINIDPSDPIVKISYPEKYSKDLADSIGLFATLGMPEETDGYEEGYLDSDAYMGYILSLEKEKEKMFWNEFSGFNSADRSVLSFVFDASDRLQHVIQTKGKDLDEHDEIVEYYKDKDRFLGEILENIDNSTLLLIVSDHGFSHFNRAVGLNNWLTENGYMTTKRETREIGDSPLFKDVDWTKTKAYSLGFTSIFINVKGREGKGIVEDKDRDNVVSDIISGLMNLKEDDGKPVFNGVYRREDIYQGNFVDDAPDIIVGYNPGYRTAWQSAVGGFSRGIITDNDKKWQGDHLIDPKFVPGVIFSNQILDVSNATGADVAPTILDALGLKIPTNMDGKSLLR